MKIKVAEILGDFGSGGVESFACNVFPKLDNNKFQIDFIVNKNSSFFYLKKLEGSNINIIKVNSCTSYHNNELRSVFLARKYDIVHSHLNTLSVFPLRIAKNAGVPIRIAHSHSSLGKGKGELARNCAKILLKNFSKKYANVFVGCSDVAASFQFGRGYVKRKKVILIPNCIDVEAAAFSQNSRQEKREELGISNSEILIGHIGRFMPQKNQHFLLDVFCSLREKNPNFRLVFFGDGPTLAETIEYSKKISVFPFIIFHKPVLDVCSFYNAFDIFALPSLYEGLPLTGLEAQANGLPCFFSDRISKQILFNANVCELPLLKEAWVDRISSTSSFRRVTPNAALVSKYSFASAASIIESIYQSFYSRVVSK